jgi:hypothetical protein
MTNKLGILLCATLVLAAGCKSAPPKRVNSGPVRATTFNFISAGVKADAAESADRREQVHKYIQDAITKNLSTKGVGPLPAGGDVIVAYLVIVGNNASTALMDKYFGYGRDAAGLQAEAQKAYTASQNPDRFEAGTLLVDVLDAKTYKLKYRSFVVRPTLRNPSAEVQAERIQEAVDEVLAGLKITN